MKQHITPEDLLQLNSSQVLNLRDMWIPEPNTVAMARICKDVINDEYDTIVFVIGEVIVQENSTRLILKSMNSAGNVDVVQEDIEELPEDAGDENEDEEFPCEYTEPDQYFSKDDCLPILNIGQLIEMLGRVKYGQDGFSIIIPPAKRFVGDRGCRVINSVEMEFEEDELCDALWKALVEFL
ncbi:MAG: hypothetical protein GX494_05280 [Clostridiaceae bacterium]|mgnify:CR=1 FL=1|nr:hypothetical protein [Clostridiaceae bacterium]